MASEGHNAEHIWGICLCKKAREGLTDFFLKWASKILMWLCLEVLFY